MKKEVEVASKGGNVGLAFFVDTNTRLAKYHMRAARRQTPNFTQLIPKKSITKCKRGSCTSPTYEGKAYCKEHLQKAQRYQKKYRECNPDRVKENNKRCKSKNSAAIRNFINSFKNVPCFDCGQAFPPYVLDFDHVRDKKLFGISRIIHTGIVLNVQKKRIILKEMQKCDLVCANCHRIRTHKRGYVHEKKD